jgi:radical SAM superfamily enzyme YgiQ (UPF0313 family)
MYSFMDAFFIGEGEEGIHDIIEVLKDCKMQRESRRVCLEKLSAIEGVYVPALYQETRTADLQPSLTPVDKSVPYPVRKRIVAELPPPLLKPIVPYVSVVHERITIEIMRGCTRGCRFVMPAWLTDPCANGR